jgi:hypothetical protein
MLFPEFRAGLKLLALSWGKVHPMIIMGATLASTKRVMPSSAAKPPEKSASKRPAARRARVALSAEAIEIVERFQGATGLSLSEAVSALIERAEPRPARIKYVDGLPTADIPTDGEWITTEDILRAQAELG